VSKKPPPKAIQATQRQPQTVPPLKAFLRLPVDPEQDAALKRLLAKYRDPTQQHQLLHILQRAKFSHQLRATLSRQVSSSRKCFMRRDRWRKRIDAIEQQLDALLRDFHKTL
jgi:predicted secreted Zn-dependent protease